MEQIEKHSIEDAHAKVLQLEKTIELAKQSLKMVMRAFDCMLAVFDSGSQLTVIQRFQAERRSSTCKPYLPFSMVVREVSRPVKLHMPVRSTAPAT
jgi:hypothetical protein